MQPYPLHHRNARHDGARSFVCSLVAVCLLALGCGDAPEPAPAPPAAAASQGTLADAAAAPSVVSTGSPPSATVSGGNGGADSGTSSSSVSVAMTADAGATPDASLSAAPSADYLGLAEPRSGFRLKTRGAPIPDNSDTELCEVAELPGTPDQEYIVGAVELANARFSHHLIVSVAQPGTAADKKLRSLPLGTQMPCVSAEIEFGQGVAVVAATQTMQASYNFPAGIGIRLHGGQRVVFDYHYFNYTGTGPVKADSAIAVYTLAPSEVKNIASSYAFTNMTLDTPPHDRGTFTAICHFKQDAMLQALARHTHTSGTDFTVWFEGGPKHGQQIWQSLDWEHDALYQFAEPIRVKAGEGFKFACSFRNDSSKPLRFGIRSTDEMCILTGNIWSPTPGAELPIESCVTTWIDAQGIGRDARDEGGFPAPKSDEVLACTLDTVGFSLLDKCVGCICSACATPFTRCNGDPDCKAILECRSGCQGDMSSACSDACEPVMFEHSSGVGMATAVGECLVTKCGSDCALGAPVRM